MKIQRLEDMTGGWFVGDFEPAAVRTPVAEVAVKRYSAGQSEGRHVHKETTEVTLIAGGRARMNGRELCEGDIVTLTPGESADFEALRDTLTVVVKVPSVPGDKYPV